MLDGRSDTLAAQVRDPSNASIPRRADAPAVSRRSLFMDPTAPLRPLLAAGVRDGAGHLGRYALPPTVLRTDDY